MCNYGLIISDGICHLAGTHCTSAEQEIQSGIITMITFWLTYEYASLNINIVSPWINLGNGLSKDILFIQWYEVTGTAGGSLWISMFQYFSYTLPCKFSHKKEKAVFISDHLANNS